MSTLEIQIDALHSWRKRLKEARRVYDVSFWAFQCWNLKQIIKIGYGRARRELAIGEPLRTHGAMTTVTN
jgi:hypothetical protein